MSVLINGKQFDAEYLTTPEEHGRGMMGRDSLDGCMVFKMGKGHHSFWMKNCLIALDIVFVNNNRISKIHSNCQPAGNKLNPPRYTGIGDHVVEFPAGTSDNWKVGDRVNLYLGTQSNPVF
jgi:uncharacterized membrane protein (UPF0127 family)